MDILRLIVTVFGSFFLPLVKDALYKVVVVKYGMDDMFDDVFSVVDEAFKTAGMNTDTTVRLDHGGERFYLSKTTEAKIMNNAQRNNAIRRAWKDGEPISVLSDRHGLSSVMIWKIVNGRS